MKKMRRLIPAFAMLMVAAIMLSTASFAWFTMGTYATASGMQVTAQAASSLLIVNGDLYDNDTALRNAFDEADNVVAFTAVGANLQPATFQAADATANTPAKLVTLKDATRVDHITGALLSGAEFEDATEDTNYIEYVAYIASAGTVMNTSNSTLQATVTLPDNLTYASMEYINRAIEVAFWVADAEDEDSEAEYVGKTNLLTVQDGSVTVDLGVTTIPVAVTSTEETQTGDDGEIVTNADGDPVKVPKHTLDYVKVYIRVYYDGALKDSSIEGNQTTYVRNDQITPNGAGINIQFDYTTKPAVNPPSGDIGG